jgi:hypothetical protein
MDKQFKTKLQVSTLPSNRILKRMGLVEDQNGILHRFQVEEKNWELHLSNTRQFINDCLKQSQAKKVAILGSGWLLDIPVDFLSNYFEKVTFYDLRHPAWVLKKYASIANLHFTVADLTGGMLSEIYKLCLKHRKQDIYQMLDELKFPVFLFPEPVDYIISSNLLNQLDILLIDYIRRFIKIDNKLEQKIRSGIQKAHLNLLKPGASCLITDYEEIHINNNDEIIDKVPLVYCTLPAGKIRKTWTWKFDTHKTYNPGHNTSMNVVAIKL